MSENIIPSAHSAAITRAISNYLVKEGIYLEERQAEQIALAIETENAPHFQMLANYRRLVGKLATNKDKANGWYIAKAWAPFWKEMGFDLTEEAEQKAFLFD